MNSTPDAHDDKPQPGDGPAGTAAPDGATSPVTGQAPAEQPGTAAGSSGDTGTAGGSAQVAPGQPSPGQVPAGQVPPAQVAPQVGGVPGVPVQMGAVPAAPVAPVAPVVKTRKPLPQPVLATLLVGGSFGGIAAIMAGLLAVLSPAPEDVQGSKPVPGGEVALQGAGTFLPPTVGPGGPGTALTAAAPTAPPPLPALQPLPPLTITTAPASAASTKVKKAASAKPVKIRIPAIGVYATVGSVGVAKSGEIGTPPLSRPSLAAWYRLGPAPGELGPAVILGHVNTRTGSAVFNRLRELKRGNKIEVRRADGKSAIFTVDGVEQVGKTTFPTNRVYGNVSTAALRLITCGGAYNAKNHSYTDNIVVYATMTGTRNAK
ncbi:class F sortase [Microtetraspora glauca]|uniref:Class F sortase n=1 Tax=Microtetraspora glauca TaxID=1996 RepID=A0ABV3G640_MICGL